MKILIIGANGMLGHTLFRFFNQRYETKGTVRARAWCDELLSGYNVTKPESFTTLFEEFKPDIVFNCVGVIKQVKQANDSEANIAINALWPHQLARMGQLHDFKVIHFSTDCVFTGERGMYTEESFCDSRDTYGLTKYLGELHYQNTLTFRTSIIGHELNSNVSLVDWFLSQTGECRGFTHAIYSGFPTITLARIIDEYVLPSLNAGKAYGLYHLSSEPISKYDLLKLIAKKYGKKIEIIPDPKVQIDRSLDSTKFRDIFNFTPSTWDGLVDEMNEFYQKFKK